MQLLNRLSNTAAYISCISIGSSEVVNDNAAACSATTSCTNDPSCSQILPVFCNQTNVVNTTKLPIQTSTGVTTVRRSCGRSIGCTCRA